MIITGGKAKINSYDPGKDDVGDDDEEWDTSQLMQDPQLVHVSMIDGLYWFTVLNYSGQTGNNKVWLIKARLWG